MNNLKYLMLALIVSFLGACSYQLEEKEAPKNLIPQDTFTMLLGEIMIVESYFKHQQNNVNAYADSLPKAMKPIFEKYKVDSARYLSSMDYYTSHQSKLIEIYSQIQDSLTIKSADYSN